MIDNQNVLTVDSLLKPFQHLGVNLGLERIKSLLDDLGNPHHSVPIIHVAGSNGKGSVCAYLSAILTEAGYKVGRYTSPHLIDWMERICINEVPINSETLIQLLQYILKKINSNTETPTYFEVTTAAAWLYFAQSEVDIAVIEVGLGGRLDATNVCEHPLVSIIASLSREHWQVLGSTLGEISVEKAGILKANCPAVIGNLPPEAKEVILSRIEQLNCPAIWAEAAVEITMNTNININTERWASYQGIEYPLPLLGNFQLMNSAIAISALQILQQKGWNIPLTAIENGMRKTRWLGRLQWTKWKDYPLLIDGAHNPASAKVLREYVDTLNKPITWVMGMLSTKEHQDIFLNLLRPNDQLYLVPVPDDSTANPEDLAILAREICPQLKEIQPFEELFVALDTAVNNHNNSEYLTVLCGSLYLVGYFLKYQLKC